MTWSSMLAFASILVLAAGTPGPSVAALVSRALANGLRDVLPFIIAKWLGEMMWLTLAVAEHAMTAQRLDSVFLVLRYGGAAYLLYLAWKMWFASTELPDDTHPERRHPWRMFLAGLLITLGNPEVMIFYTALLPSVAGLGQPGPVVWLQLVVTALIVLATVDLSWALLASRARRLLRSERAILISNHLSAALMLGAAIAIIVR
ncbi:MAG TPA: LysE family translocator [Geminicoccus sp.]|jgi:threonine/homoserine/homoserine lactone efflux protein|uniref:LysE family translocator n=1 Tax=Geminicoccus sp. TaxID=2024832 RepID=UPI002E375D66|nr:LysE family translocator [Geminicoccus sp.]HEX2526532.1 LysE family translocator [Geminicoccus sp.]